MPSNMTCVAILGTVVLSQGASAQGLQVPPWISVPDCVGDFVRTRDDDLATYQIVARYEAGDSRCDVFVYTVPMDEQRRRLSLEEEAHFVNENIAALVTLGRYDRVEAWKLLVPADTSVGQRMVPGVLAGADIVRQGRKGTTFTTLFEVDGYRIKMRRTHYGKIDVDEVLSFSRALLQAMLSAATGSAAPQ